MPSIGKSFSTTAKKLITWLGLNKSKLPASYQAAVKTFTKPGGTAEQQLGKIKEVEIKHRDGVAVHQSSFNPADKAFIVSAKIVGEKKTRVCHIYEDGTGTLNKGDQRR